MRRLLTYVLYAAVALMAAGVVVFRYALDISWLDACYFVVTTVTTVGYGDYHLQQAAFPVKLFGMVLMVVGTAATAAIFGLVTDYLLRARLEELIGKRKVRRMKDHIILCGLGHLGMRALEHLHRLGEKVLVLEREGTRHLHPSEVLPIRAGDWLVLSTIPGFAPRLHELNAIPATT